MWQDNFELSGQVHVHADSDPYWVTPEDLAPFGTLSQNLDIWKQVEASCHQQCQMLSLRSRATPSYPSLMHVTCPTIVVLGALKQAGWHQHPAGKCVHDQASMASGLMLCDTRGGCSKKFYLQCLLDLGKHLALTSRMPSDGIQLYYKCLLAGKRAEPGKQEAYYRGILRDAPVEVLPLADAPSGPALGDGNEGSDEDIIMVSGAAVPKPAAPKKTPVAPSAMKGFLPFSTPSSPNGSSRISSSSRSSRYTWCCILRGCPSSTIIAPSST